ncbi:MAG: DUF481 domain-containing protein [Candidatus Hydrogenedentes bacterium]|nr:DUF481 domain-containing protein [Candidatus Hydrogenedentota bacterium]
MCSVLRIAPALLASTLLAFWAAADSITLKDGDQLSGALVELADEVVVFRTELAGTMIVPVSQVTTVVTARDVQCVFKDGGRAVGRLAGGEEGMRFLPAGGEAAVPITPSMLVSVAPVPLEAPPASTSPPAPGHNLTMETGSRYVTGNDDYIALYTRLRLRATRDNYLLLTDAQIEFGDTDELPTSGELVATWRLRPDAALSPAVYLGLERDTIETLDLRMTLALGAYHKFLDSGRHLLEGTLGAAVESEQWNRSRLRGLDVFPSSSLDAEWYYRSADAHRDLVDLRLHANARHVLQLFKNAQFEEQLGLYPSLTDLDDWRAAYESRLLFPLTERLQLNLNLSIDYDNRPAYRYLDEWRAAVGAGIEWKF